jgi:copper resistance protein B
MKKRLLLPVLLCLWGNAFALDMEDDPIIGMAIIDKLEVQDTGDQNPKVWSADAWVGRDLNKLWLKTEGEVVNGETEEAQLQLLYSHAVAPFWDFQVGARRDFRPEPERNWLALGFKGLAPYLFDVDAAVFIGEEGRGAARLDAEYEYLFTQRLVLIPEVEANLYTKDDEELGIGKGLSDLTLGLRLAYQIRREFAPYVGYRWTSLYGDTADFAEAEGADTRTDAWVAGVKIWF